MSPAPGRPYPCMTRPPSTLRACPVMYPEGRGAGEEGDHVGHVFRLLHAPQRHQRLARWRVNSSADMPRRAPCSLRHLRPHVRLHEAGAHAVDADAFPGVGEGEALGHAHHRGLARVVGEGRSCPRSCPPWRRGSRCSPLFWGGHGPGITAWLAKNTALALMFMMASQCSSVMSCWWWPRDRSLRC